ncbi:MAG: hypothetical protein ACLGHN_04695 [Bacteriovoracia bacterium]
MKIAIAFFGLPRCSEKAFPTIESNIFKQLPKDAEVKCFYHFYLQTEVVNPHSGENGPFDQSNYDYFKKYEGIFEKPSEVLPTLPFEDVKKYGDAWNDNFNNVKNLFLQLNSLKKVTELVGSFDPDVVLFARPDLVYHDPIFPEYYELCLRNPDAVFIPDWQWGIGLNDCFAVTGKDAYKVYGKRIDEVFNYCTDNGIRPLHSERLLKYALLKHKKEILVMKVKASRVRMNGNLANENYNMRISFFSPLTNSQKRFFVLSLLKTKFKFMSIKKPS